MNLRNIFLAAILFAASVSEGRDLRTRSGEIFRDVTVTKVDVCSIRITHRDGTAAIDFKMLPTEVQKEFGFNEAACEALQNAGREQVALADVRRRAMVAAAESQRLADIEAKRALQESAAYALPQTMRSQEVPSSEPAVQNGFRPDYTAPRGYATRDYSARSYTPRPKTATLLDNEPAQKPVVEPPPDYTPPSNYTPPSGGSVQVRGYYRKDGTYVRPHTRKR